LTTTTITPNRITIFIMNLWVNRLKQLAFVPVALFFLACEDETSLLGYKDPNDKFDGKYVEIPLNSSVFLLDSIRTSNFFYSGETNRLLVGRYTDKDATIGEVKCDAATEFWNSSVAKIPKEVFENETWKMEINILFDLDYYAYGYDAGETPQVFNVYALEKPLSFYQRSKYFNYSTVSHKPELLGTATVLINQDTFLTRFGRSGAPRTVVSVPVTDQTFSADLWEFARQWTVNNDSTFVKYDSFKLKFPGVYLEAVSGDKIFGIKLGDGSGIEMKYRTATDTVSRILTFNTAGSFTHIQSKWNDAPKYTDITTAPGKRYVQGGTGLVTKVSLDNFYKFIEADSVKNALFNSVQLVIDGVEFASASPDSINPPPNLALRWLNELQHPVRVGQSPASVRQSAMYQTVQDQDYMYFDEKTQSIVGDVIIDNNRNLLARNDQGSPAALTFSPTDTRYSGFTTLLFYQLKKNAAQPDRFNEFVLFPASTTFLGIGLKSVDRAIFPSDKIMLKIYYTEPKVNQN
jgi:hypothetical protein